MNVLPQLFINTLQIGAVYVLFALGLTLIFGVMRVINFAHGEFFSLAALVTAVFVSGLSARFGFPIWIEYLLSFIGAVAVVVIVAILIYKVGFERYLRDMVAGFIISLGLVLLLQGLYLEIFGGLPRNVPTMIEGSVTILGASLTIQRVIICGLSLVVTVVLFMFVKHTRLGMALRAMAEDHEAAMLQGIAYRRIAFYGFCIGSLLAAIAGCLIAPLTVVVPTMGSGYLIKAFMIVIIGGLGSIPGAIIASFIIALVESVGGYLWDLSTATLIIFALVIVLLLFRPQGLLGHAEK